MSDIVQKAVNASPRREGSAILAPGVIKTATTPLPVSIEDINTKFDNLEFSVSPTGVNQYYGTDESGVLGYHDLP